MNNILYISGVHGCGKSTLRKFLEKDPDFLLHNRPGHVKLDEVYPRQLWRLVRYNIEVMDQLKWVEGNPGKMIIGDRCVYDNLMYNRCFRDLGWLDEEEFNKLEAVYRDLFDEPIRPKYIVFLNPPLEDIIGWIKKRWDVEGKKWNEEKFEYLTELKKQYENFYRNELKDTEVLEINTTNREEQIKQMKDWLGKKPE